MDQGDLVPLAVFGLFFVIGPLYFAFSSRYRK